MLTRPLLCATAKKETDIQFPCLATPKLDGIRCLIRDTPCTRSFKPIQNAHISEALSQLPFGLDGELMVVGEEFNDLSGAIRRHDGKPDFEYWVFDAFGTGGYSERTRHLESLALPSFCRKLLPTLCNNLSELLAFEEACLTQGYEGVITRKPSGPYKFGRSTLREQIAVKLKRFTDSEAIIIGFVESMENTNEIERNAFGLARRPGGRAMHQPKNTLGAFLVRDIYTGVESRIGTGEGLTAALRQTIWNNQAAYLGQIVKYRYQECGTKDKPRFPSWQGFRDPDDL